MLHMFAVVFDRHALMWSCRQSIRRVREIFRNYREDTPLREQFLTGFVFLCGVIFAAGGFLFFQSYSRTEAQREFDGPATEFIGILNDSIDRHVKMLEPAGAVFAESDKPVNRWQFFEYAQELLPNYPGVRALQWIPRVPDKRRARFQKNATKDGLLDFRFLERGPAGDFVEAGRRAEYYPIYYIEPFEGNESGLGTDLAADPMAWSVLNRALETGRMVGSRRFDSSLADGVAEDFSIVLPVFRSEVVPFTVEERRAAVIGFVRAIYRLDGLIESALPGMSATLGLDVYVFDQAAAEGDQLLHYHPSPRRSGMPKPLTKDEALSGLYSSIVHSVADLDWTIAIRPVPSFFTRNLYNASWLFVTFTLLFTAILVQYLLWSQNRTRAIERSVAERTVELEGEITERKRVEKELRSAKDQAEMANRAKSEFLAMMSHELRTPLNAVIGFAEVMHREFFGPLGNEQYRRYAEDIHVSGTHLLSLINDILDLSKIEANRFELHEEVIAVADIWQEVSSILQDSLASAGLKLECDVPTTLPHLLADQRAFRQILLNLLSNAIKFTKERGTISVRSFVNEEGSMVLNVRDTGIGIAQKDLETVLLPFKQVDSSLARKYEGTGLGLPLTQRLMRMHGGDLTLASVLGEGTTVTLIFPAERVGHDPAPVGEARDAAAVERLPERNGHLDPGAPARSTDAEQRAVEIDRGDGSEAGGDERGPEVQRAVNG